MRPFVPLLLLSAAGCHSVPSAVKPSILPLRSVRLYETGVAYFERSGALAGDQAGLPVPAGHLDDALKTLVMLGPAGGTTVQGVAFPSSVSNGMGRALAGLPQSEDPIQYMDLLVALRGAQVEVRGRYGAHRGRLVEVNGPDNLQLLLLSDRGELVRLPAKDLYAVRPTDDGTGAYAGRLRAALDAQGARGARAQRLLRLMARASGPVTIGYIAEAPLYRVSYRLVLEDGGKAGALQGWALLHNDADEDWRGVQVRLVNGRPDSFLFPLAAPRYGRRELLHPENELSTVPQLLRATADTLWGDHVDESYGAGGLGLSGSGAGGGGTGSGTIGLGNIGTVGRGGGVLGESGLLSVGNLAGVAQAAGVEAGALFTYTLAEPLSVTAHSSALVPFLQRGLPAETLTYFATARDPARSAVRLTNATPQTLPEGPIALFAGGGFAGEAVLPRLKPGEQRFLTYGADLDVELSVLRSKEREEPRRVRLVRSPRHPEQLEEHFLRHGEQVYEIRSRGGQRRSVYLGLGLRKNATVEGADRLDYDSAAARPVAVFDLAAQGQVQRTLRTTEGLTRKSAVKDLSAARLLELASAALPAPERAALQAAARHQQQIEALRKDEAAQQAEANKLDKDLARWRENLKALGGADKGGAAQPFVQRVVALEGQLQALHRKQEERKQELARLGEALLESLRPLEGALDAP